VYQPCEKTRPDLLIQFGTRQKLSLWAFPTQEVLPPVLLSAPRRCPAVSHIKEQDRRLPARVSYTPGRAVLQTRASNAQRAREYAGKHHGFKCQRFGAVWQDFTV
jgi:hypothetical protein